VLIYILEKNFLGRQGHHPLFFEEKTTGSSFFF